MTALHTVQHHSPDTAVPEGNSELPLKKAYEEESDLKKLLGVDSEALYSRTIRQLANIIEAKDIDEMLEIAVALLVDINPRDAIEGMLATQMIATHFMSMRMNRCAMHHEQTPEGIEKNVNRAIKLQRTYAAQMEALNKYRTKGQQTIQVQHVNVEAGGRAVVGNLNAGGGR